MLASPSVHLWGIASRSPERSEAFRAEFNLPRAYGSYEELLADPRIQAVYIPLPNGLHAEWAIKAAQCGKHVLCEKPLTTSAQEVAHIVDVTACMGVHIMEAFMWRFHPQHLRAQAAIRSGAIGPLQLVRSCFSYVRDRSPNVRLNSALGGGSILDIGVYPVNAARFYFEAEPVSVFARGRIDPEFHVDMRMCAVMDFPKGHALIDCAFDLPYRGDLELVGENGRILIPRPWLPDPQATVIINDQPETLAAASQYVEQLEHFSRCILSGLPPRYGTKDSLLQMRAIDAIFKSMDSGNPVAV
jgi:predicted dehydrogenase